MSEKKILDVIIPAYKAQDTITRALGSLLPQTVLDKVKVTIVNDADPTGDYQDIIKSFSPYMDIQEIKLEQNGGPGVARQYGIDNTDLPFFTCVDADDSFANAFSVARLLKELEEDPKIIMNVGSFAEDHNNGTFLNHPNDMIWMFGKVYRREFIKRYNIRFNETRANEDNGFNSTIRLLVSPNERVNFIEDIVYFWHYKEDSITRINNAEYSYNQSFPGYTINMVDSVKNAREYKPFNPDIDIWAIGNMAKLYNYYYQTVGRDKRFAEQNFGYCLYYYKEIYADIRKRFNEKQVNPIFSEVFVAQASSMQGLVPDKTIHQFIDLLEKIVEEEPEKVPVREIPDWIKKEY